MSATAHIKIELHTSKITMVRFNLPFGRKSSSKTTCSNRLISWYKAIGKTDPNDTIRICQFKHLIVIEIDGRTKGNELDKIRSFIYYILPEYENKYVKELILMYAFYAAFWAYSSDVKFLIESTRADKKVIDACYRGALDGNNVDLLEIIDQYNSIDHEEILNYIIMLMTNNRDCLGYLMKNYPNYQKTALKCHDRERVWVSAQVKEPRTKSTAVSMSSPTTHRRPSHLGNLATVAMMNAAAQAEEETKADKADKAAKADNAAKAAKADNAAKAAKAAKADNAAKAAKAAKADKSPREEPVYSELPAMTTKDLCYAGISPLAGVSSPANNIKSTMD